MDFRIMHPAIVSRAFQEMAIKAWQHPAEIVKEQINYWNSMAELWQKGMAKALFNKEFEPVAAPGPADRRFKDEAWAENVVFDCIKQCYLLTSRHLQSAVGRVEGLDDHTTKKVQFYTRQFIDAMSPTNFAATNPEVLKATIESKGQNLLEGVAHMMQDLDRNKGNFNVKMTNLEHFHIGENLATTPGKVIYQNEMMQLLQYAPSTETVRKRPLLIFPAWINRFYILDLQPKNSLVKWAVDQGHTVFLMSWVNPDESYADKTFDEYLLKGPMAALDAIEQATGEKEVNAVGWCIGGTLLAITSAYMAAKQDKRIVSATYFTSMLDFTDPGEIGVFIDDAQIDLLEKHMRHKGLLEGHHLAEAFSMLRENDLIWSFFVKDYLLGQEPTPFDILYWNSELDQHARGDAHLLCPQHVPPQSFARTGRHHACRRGHRSSPHHDSPVLPVGQRGPYRSVEVDLCRNSACVRSGAVRPGGFGPYRRGSEPPRRQEILLLDERKDRRHSGRVACRGRAPRRIVVGGLGSLGWTVRRGFGAGPAAWRRRAQADRRCARFLRENGAHPG